MKPRRITGEHPTDNSRPAGAVVPLRESSIITLFKHGVISGEQVEVAWRFQRSWELVEQARRVSVGFDERAAPGPRTGLAERVAAAHADLRQAERILGNGYGYDLVSRICGDGFHIRDLFKTRRERDTAADMLRLLLTDLALKWR